MSSELPAAVKDRQEAGLDKDEVVRLVNMQHQAIDDRVARRSPYAQMQHCHARIVP